MKHQHQEGSLHPYDLIQDCVNGIQIEKEFENGSHGPVMQAEYA